MLKLCDTGPCMGPATLHRDTSVPTICSFHVNEQIQKNQSLLMDKLGAERGVKIN